MMHFTPTKHPYWGGVEQQTLMTNPHMLLIPAANAVITSWFTVILLALPDLYPSQCSFVIRFPFSTGRQRAIPDLLDEPAGLLPEGRPVR